jgi:ribosome-associated translation inhibitor RaiA
MSEQLPPIIKVSRGRTINLGNYESERVDISVEIPSKGILHSEVETAYEKAINWVEGHLETQVALIEKKRLAETVYNG